MLDSRLKLRVVSPLSGFPEWLILELVDRLVDNLESGLVGVHPVSVSVQQSDEVAGVIEDASEFSLGHSLCEKLFGLIGERAERSELSRGELRGS